MGQPIARIGDTIQGNCSKHGPVSGNFTQGSNVCTADGIPVVLVGHAGVATCGHHFAASSGSSISDVLGVPVVRVGDSVVFTDIAGSGTVSSGSPTSDSN